MRKIICCLVVVPLLLAGGRPADAQETPWTSAEYVQARLLGATKGVGTAPDVGAAFDLRLSDGWHAYWRMPGDGGLPPRFDWSDSENVKDVKVLWPLPERFEIAGLYSFGYMGEVLLPLRIEPETPGKSVRLSAHADIMVCKDICVPQTVDLTLDIPQGEAAPGAYKPRIDRALQDVPGTADLPALKIENVVIGPQAIVVNAFSQQGFDKTDLFVEAGDLYVTAVPEITVDKDDKRKAMLRVAAPEGVENLAEFTAGRPVTLTLTNGRNAVEKTVNW